MSEERPAESGVDDAGDDTPGGDAQDIGESAEQGATAAFRPQDGEEEDGGRVEPESHEESEDGAQASAIPASESPEEMARSLEEARRDAQAHREMTLRVRAELENVRRRAERDVASAHKYGLERFVNELLPVRDSLELGVSAAGDDADIARAREGMELTLKLMATAFDKLGLEVIDPSGEPFDPESHQAMSMQEGEQGQSGSVLTVVQKGYRLNERLVRPALVVVAK